MYPSYGRRRAAGIPLHLAQQGSSRMEHNGCFDWWFRPGSFDRQSLRTKETMLMILSTSHQKGLCGDTSIGMGPLVLVLLPTSTRSNYFTTFSRVRPVLLTFQAQQSVTMPSRRSRSQVRRDEEKAGRRKALNREKADRRRDREKRHEAAELRRSQSHQQSSHQQTVRLYFSYEKRDGNTHHSHNHVYDTDCGTFRTKVNVTTNTYSRTLPAGRYSPPPRHPRPDPQRTHVYTNEGAEPNTTYKDKGRPSGEQHEYDRRYSSTRPRGPPKPRWPDAQASKPHYQSGRPRFCAPGHYSPNRSPSPSVIYPTSISEPDTVIAHSTPRLQNAVKMLPTPTGSEFDKSPPPSTNHTGGRSWNKPPAAHADRIHRNTSSHRFEDRGTQSAEASSSVRPRQTATQTQRFNRPSDVPVGETSDNAQSSNRGRDETLLREAVRRSARSSHAEQPSSLPLHIRSRRWEPRDWTEYNKTTPSMVNSPRQSHIEIPRTHESIPSKLRSLAATSDTKTARTRKIQVPRQTSATARITDTTQTAKSSTRARTKRRPGLGESTRNDPRDYLGHGTILMLSL